MDDNASARRVALPTPAARVDLGEFRREARALLVRLRETEPEAQLARAQFLVAREHGFRSWRALRAGIDRTPTASPATSDRPDGEACVGHYSFEYDQVVTVSYEGRSLFTESGPHLMRYRWDGAAWTAVSSYDARNGRVRTLSFSNYRDGEYGDLTQRVITKTICERTGHRISAEEAKQRENQPHCSLCRKPCGLYKTNAKTMFLVAAIYNDAVVCEECIAANSALTNNSALMNKMNPSVEEINMLFVSAQEAFRASKAASNHKRSEAV